MRNVIAHLHIMKNGGGTIEWILVKNFGSQFAMADYHEHLAPLPFMNAVGSFLDNNHQVRAISAQAARFPLPKIDSVNYLPIVVLRHPIDRAFSIYHFHRRQSDGGEGVQKAKSSSPQEYFEWALANNFEPICNGQAKYLAWKDFKRPLLEVALQRLRSCLWVGALDRLDESLVVLEHLIKPYFEDKNLAYRPKHVRSGRENDLQSRIEKGKDILGNHLFAELVKKNQTDLKLFYSAKEQLARQISDIHDFQQRLSDFRSRCGKMIEGFGYPKTSKMVLKYNKEEKKLYERPPLQ